MATRRPFPAEFKNEREYGLFPLHASMADKWGERERERERERAVPSSYFRDIHTFCVSSLYVS